MAQASRHFESQSFVGRVSHLAPQVTNDLDGDLTNRGPSVVQFHQIAPHCHEQSSKELVTDASKTVPKSSKGVRHV